MTMPPPADVIGPLGRKKTLSVRLGDTLFPRTIHLPLGRGAMDLTGGAVGAGLYLRPFDLEPLPEPTFDVKPLGATAEGMPRFRLELSAAKVKQLAQREPYAQAVSRTAPRERTYFWRSWVIDSNGARFTLYYGPFVVLLGALDADP